MSDEASLYTSKAGSTAQNLISLALTPLRVEAVCNGKAYVVACDLLRPISRKVLRALGEVDERTSQTVIATVLRLLAT